MNTFSRQSHIRPLKCTSFLKAPNFRGAEARKTRRTEDTLFRRRRIRPQKTIPKKTLAKTQSHGIIRVHVEAVKGLPSGLAQRHVRPPGWRAGAKRVRGSSRAAPQTAGLAWRALTAVLPWRAVDKASRAAFRIRRVFVELASCAGPHDRTAVAMWSAQTQMRIDTRHVIRRTNAEAAWRRFCKGPKQDREGPSEAPRPNQRNLIDAASAFLFQDFLCSPPNTAFSSNILL